MASLSVAAIVVSHARADLLEKSLAAIANQTHGLEQVVVVETAGDEQCIALARSFGFSVISPGNQQLGAAIQSGINSLSKTPGWIWVLHDDAVAEPDALKFLAQAAEISPSVAIIGPKLLELDNPIQIQQLGLTATPTGRPFLLVQREYDQGQHDRAGDTLAVSTAGMLVSLGVWQQLGGLDNESPILGQDLEFGAKARIAGYRVIVETKARVHHAGLAMKNQRSKNWLSGSAQQAISRAHIHFATIYLPWFVVFGLYLLMPLLVLFMVPLNLLNKRPMRSVSQFAGWIWAWISLPKRIAARSRFRALGNLKVIRPLLASKLQRKQRRKGKYEFAPEEPHDQKRPGFFGSNSGWLALWPLGASIHLFPTGALTANNFVPLGSSFSNVFESLGSSTLPYLSGSELPADPFGWWALVSAALWPSNPSIAFAALVFLAPTIAFLGVWQLAKQFISKAWVVSLVALSYALSPQLLQLKSDIWAVELLAAMTFPWAMLFVYRAFSTYANARAWRWVGLAGITMALVAASAPMVFALLVLVVLVLAVIRPLRGLILIWSPIPAVMVLYPQLELVSRGAPWQLLTSASAYSQPPIEVFTQLNTGVIAAVAAVGLASWFVSRSVLVAGLWVFSIGALALSWVQPLSSSSVLVLAGLAALLILAGLVIEQFSGRVFIGLVSVVAFSAIGFSTYFFGILGQQDPGFSQSRTLPALVEAASEQDEDLRTMVITPGSPILVSYLWGSGLKLEHASLAHQLMQGSDDLEGQLAEIAGNLVAGNQEKLVPLLAQTKLDFVLLAEPNPDYRVGLDSLSNLQAAGSTSFGDLYKVLDAKPIAGQHSKNGATRNIQLGVFAAYALLALPTKSSILGRRRKGLVAK